MARHTLGDYTMHHDLESHRRPRRALCREELEDALYCRVLIGTLHIDCRGHSPGQSFAVHMASQFVEHHLQGRV